MNTLLPDYIDELDYVALEEQYGAHNYKPLDVVLCRGAGAWVWDVEGNKYLDCLSAYSALNQGHCHPRLVKAVVDQVATLTLTSRAFRNDQLGQFYQSLCEISGYEKVLPMNSGAEAVETALKVARKWATVVRGVPANQSEIIVCEGNFHGRTISIISASSEPEYRDHFGPFTPGFVFVPYGDAEALRAAITERTAAFLVEPIQGEAGVRVPPAGYLRQVAEICREHNILFMADEIQTGLGRTGAMFCFQHEDARPDVVILGKALSGGMYPVSAVISDEPVLGLFQPGEHGSTFGGNPLAARIGREALQIILDEGLVERAAELGHFLLRRLREIDSPYIREVRGKGLLVGIELHPEAGGARRFCEALARRGLLCKETHTHVLRIAPPLVIGLRDLDWAVGQVEAVLTMGRN